MLRNSIIAFTVFILSSCSSKEEISTSPEIIRGIYDSGTSSCYLAFKQDGTFEWFSGSSIGASTAYQGKYSLQDSVFYLDRSDFSSVIKSNRLLLTSKHPLSGGTNDEYIIQVDSLIRLVDSVFIFMVIHDKRGAL
ncbi:hypothetical protein [Hymenobacter mucosus]|uniref:hypothetical protein n=1 Tax=Hymenobacter mucosus TaxID=1411120 RepID=UPI00117AEDF5|nr:hypothetical protein [Hymenobacter mucosus]